MTEWLKRYDLVAIVILFLLATVAERFEIFNAIEDQTVSVRHLLRGHDAFPDNVVFVNTDEEFFEEYKGFPLRRTDLARIVNNIHKLGAKVVGVDLLFDFPSSYNEDPATAQLLSQSGAVVTVSTFDSNTGELNYPIAPIEAVVRTGYTNIQSSSLLIETMSRLHVFQEAAELKDGWPFAVQALSMYEGVTPSLREGVLQIGDRAIELDHRHDFRIDYPLFPPGARTYSEYYGKSALEYLDLSKADDLDDLRAHVEGKIVLLGDTSEISHDYFDTPIGTVYGVEIIGATIDTLQRGAPLQPAPEWLEILVTVLGMVGLLYTATIGSPNRRFFSAAVQTLIWLGIAVGLYVATDLILSMTYVFVAGFLGFLATNLRHYLQERSQKALIRDAFGQYLSPKVVNILVKDPTKLSLGGERRKMTAMFSDVAGFSSISERLSPEELVALLNEYLSRMCDIIAEYDGTVDKFEGDAIIAFWGAPLEQPNHAELACLATIDMQRYMKGYRKTLAQQNRPTLNVRIGLNTGDMLVGNLGSRQRMDYTIMGDAVNLASRLEGANKNYGTEAMISEHTYRQVESLVEVRELDRIRVVGKREAVTVYELLERKGYLPDAVRAAIEEYRQGLQLYRGARFEQALVRFQQVLTMQPDDGPAKTYVDRCEHLLRHPPAGEWDGVFELTTK